MRMLCRNGARLFEIPLEVLSKQWRKAVFCLIIAVYWAADGLVSCVPLSSSSANHFANSFASYTSNSSDQCLYLTKNQSMRICDLQVSERNKMIRNYRLKFCSSYNLFHLISVSDMARPCRLKGSKNDCSGCLNSLVELDEDIYKTFYGFEELLDRFDCNTAFSVKWNCSHCKRAYKEWLCATQLSFYYSGKRMLPCDSFCTRIEQMCPFFRPRNIDTHTGDPGFICKDKDISTDARFTKYGSEPYCYKLCHLIDVKEEFGNDSDSKCHKLKPIPNVTNIPHSTSSSQIKHSFALGDLIHMLAFVWTIRTILQITDIGLT